MSGKRPQLAEDFYALLKRWRGPERDGRDIGIVNLIDDSPIAIWKPFEDMDDTYVALLLPSALDEALRVLLAARKGDGATTIKSLTEARGRMADIAGRRDLAYLLGLITKEQKSDIEFIAEVRNLFGHSFTVRSFSEEEITELCRKLGWQFADDPRESFTTTGLIRLNEILRKAEELGWRPPAAAAAPAEAKAKAPVKAQDGI